MLFRRYRSRASVVCALASLVLLATLVPVSLRAQDDDSKPEQHGRKYKPPPETSTIEVTVIKAFNKKPIDGAHVIFHPVKDGVDEGNLEVKTHPDGKATIDVIPTGSKVTIQVIADGFATFAQVYQIDEASRSITIAVIRPRAQVSAYVDNDGKPAQMQPGVQEPIRPKPAAAAGSSSTPGAATANAATTSTSSSGSDSGSSSNSSTKPQP